MGHFRAHLKSQLSVPGEHLCLSHGVGREQHRTDTATLSFHLNSKGIWLTTKKIHPDTNTGTDLPTTNRPTPCATKGARKEQITSKFNFFFFVLKLSKSESIWIFFKHLIKQDEPHTLSISNQTLQVCSSDACRADSTRAFLIFLGVGPSTPSPPRADTPLEQPLHGSPAHREAPGIHPERREGH